MMGLTGLLLVAFLVEHLVGNLTLFQDDDGTAFEEYKAFMESFGPLLRVAEVGLFVLFALHVVLALRLNIENLQARGRRYVIRSSRGRSTAASLSMLATGTILLAFLAKHWLDFRFDEAYHESPAATVHSTLHDPFTGAVYLFALAALGLHLAHGFRSAFQSLGISHPTIDPLLERLGILVAALFALGFAAFPVYFLFFWTGGGT